MRRKINYLLEITVKNWPFAILFASAAFLRLYHLESFLTFLGDQGRDAIVIKRIITGQHFPAIGPVSSVGGVFLGPFYYYLMAPFLLLWNFNPVGLGYGVAIISIIGFLASYIIVKKEINKKTALIFTFLIAFSATNVSLARFSWNPNLLPLFSFITLYFLKKTLEKIKNKKKIIVITGFFGAFLAFSIQLHYLALSLIITSSIFLIWGLIKNHKKNRWLLVKKNIVIFLSFIFFNLPLILFDIKNHFLNSKNFLKLFNEQSGSIKPTYLARLVEVNRAFTGFILNIHTTEKLSIAFTLLIIIASSYLIMKKTPKKNSFLIINLVNLIVFLIVFSFLFTPRYPHYYGIIYYSFFLLTSFIFSRLRGGKNIFTVIILIVYFYLNFQSFGFLYHQGSHQIEQAQTVAKSISKQIDTGSFQIVSIPFIETHGHIRYFLEIYGKTALAETSLQQPNELFVICHLDKCKPTDNAQWQIAVFKNKKISKMWIINGLKIYKIIHEN